jgi:hypothetical protein
MQEKKLKFEDLMQRYDQICTASKDLWAEQRSNSMLVAGNHYSTKTADTWNRIRDLRAVPTDQKLRLTKNHIKKITNLFQNNLVSSSPAVKVIPRDEKSNQSRKSAELNDAVWQFACDTEEMPIRTLSLAADYIELGESATKIFWHPTAGKIVSYNQKVDETNQPMVDEQGQPVADEASPNFEGKLMLEQVLPTNIGVDLNCSSFEEADLVFVRKMMPHSKLKALVQGDEEKLKLIQEEKPDPTMVFDPSISDYSTSKEMSLVIEFYLRPCQTYPKGYYYITTKTGILFEGELPFGIFPIEYVGFDKIQANPRHRSIIKQLRPYQLEINRTASKIAEHQITSDDKILVQNGTKISSGANLAGIRLLQYSGAKPEIMEGRSGAQYLDYLSGQIQEMYQVANLAEDAELKPATGADPYGLLFRSVKDQKKFIIYSEKFEHYLKRICKLYLRLAKEYLDDDVLIPMIGKSEYVNIAEFKNTQDLDTNIKVIPMTDDINTMFGKVLATNHLLQFSSAQLGKEEIARIARNMPFGNFEESFADLMLDYDLAENLMLAVERGEQTQASPADNKDYLIKKLQNRVRQADFSLLDPQIQQNYQQLLQTYMQMSAQEKAEIQRAQSGFIPATGPLVRTDLKAEVANASGGKKTISKAFPIDALAWLEKQMEIQGASLESLRALDQQSQAGVASQLNGLNQPQGMGQQPMATPPQGVPNGY